MRRALNDGIGRAAGLASARGAHIRDADNASRGAAAPEQSKGLSSTAQPPLNLSDNLAGRGVDALAVDEARGRVRALRAAEEEDVRLRPVNGVVHPAAALLHAQAAPLALREQAALGRILRDVLGQDHVAAGARAVAGGRDETHREIIRRSRHDEKSKEQRGGMWVFD